MNRRVCLVAISWIGALAGLTLLVFVLTGNAPVQATVIDSPVSVSITESGFDPPVVTVAEGTTVMWTNHTQETVHLMSGVLCRIYIPLVLRIASNTRVTTSSPPLMSAVVARQQDDWGDVDIASNGSYTHTFVTTGDHPYYLEEHPSITGLIVVPVPTFALGVWPLTQEVMQGESVTYTVAVTGLYSFAEPVALGISGAPADAAVSWATNPLVPTADTTLIITPSLASPTSEYALELTGTSGGLVRSTSFTLVVVHRPESGHYTGVAPSVSFDVTEGLEVCNLDITVPFGIGSCRIRPSECAEIAVSDFKFARMEFGAIFVITGTFDTHTHVVGGYGVSMCGNKLISPPSRGSWEASR